MHPAGHQDRQPTHTQCHNMCQIKCRIGENLCHGGDQPKKDIYITSGCCFLVIFPRHLDPIWPSMLREKKGVAGAVQTPLAIMMAVLALQHFLVWRLREVIYKIWVVGFNRHSCNPWLWKWREHYGYGQKHVPYIPHFWLSDLWKNVGSPWRIRSYSIHKFKIRYIYIYLFMGYKHMTYYIYYIWLFDDIPFTSPTYLPLAGGFPHFLFPMISN
jgi:hypothetical protein